MRNTSQYPITVDEAISSVKNSTEHWNSLMQLGDVRGYSCSLVKEFLEKNREALEKFLIEKCTK